MHKQVEAKTGVHKAFTKKCANQRSAWVMEKANQRSAIGNINFNGLLCGPKGRRLTPKGSSIFFQANRMAQASSICQKPAPILSFKSLAALLYMPWVFSNIYFFVGRPFHLLLGFHLLELGLRLLLHFLGCWLSSRASCLGLWTLALTEQGQLQAKQVEQAVHPSCTSTLRSLETSQHTLPLCGHKLHSLLFSWGEAKNIFEFSSPSCQKIHHGLIKAYAIHKS